MTHVRTTAGLFAAFAIVALAASCGGDGGTTVPPVDPPAPQNRQPVAVGSIAAIDVKVGETATTDVASNFNDPDNDALTYAAATSNADVATATMSGSVVTTTGEGAGSATITITARDPGGLTATQTMAVTVEAVNNAPMVVGMLPDTTLNVGDTLTEDVAGLFTDHDDDSLTFAATSSDAAVATASVSGDTLTVEAVAKGSATVTVSATDPGDESAEFAFTVTVPNREPEAVDAIPAQTLTVPDTVKLVVSMYFTDPDGDELTYEAVSSDTGVAEALAKGDTVQIAAMTAGSVTVAVTAMDPEGLEVTQEVSVTVQAPANRAPEAADSIPAHDVVVDSAVVLDISAYFSDPDGDELTYSAETSDAAIATASVDGSVVTTTGVSAGEEGVQMVTLIVTARDPEGSSVTQEVDVSVAAEEYEAWEGLSINDMGVVTALGGAFQLTGCFTLGLVNAFASQLNIKAIYWTEWQIRKGTGWVRVPRTRQEPADADGHVICAYKELIDRADGTPGPAPAGTYRVVGEVDIEVEGVDVRFRRKTENEFVHDPGS